MTTIERSLGPSAVPELQSLYETYDWWADRGADEIHRAFVGTDEVIALREERTDELVAAARVLTDYTYYAMVFDVIVHADRRGEGLGKELMSAVVTHPPLAEVTLTLLAREGLVGFYESVGFEETGSIARPDGDPEPLRYLAYRRDE